MMKLRNAIDALKAGLLALPLLFAPMTSWAQEQVLDRAMGACAAVGTPLEAIADYLQKDGWQKFSPSSLPDEAMRAVQTSFLESMIFAPLSPRHLATWERARGLAEGVRRLKSVSGTPERVFFFHGESESVIDMTISNRPTVQGIDCKIVPSEKLTNGKFDDFAEQARAKGAAPVFQAKPTMLEEDGVKLSIGRIILDRERLNETLETRLDHPAILLVRVTRNISE